MHSLEHHYKVNILQPSPRLRNGKSFSRHPRSLPSVISKKKNKKTKNYSQRLLFSPKDTGLANRVLNFKTLGQYVKQIASGKLVYNTGNPAWCSVTSQGDGMGVGVGRQAQEGRDIVMTNSSYPTAEINTTSYSNYPPIK